MSLLQLSNQDKIHELTFTNHCKKVFVTDIDEHSEWNYIHNELAQRVVQALKDPLVPSHFRPWIKERGFHLDENNALCVAVGEESVSKVKSWKKVAVVEEFYSIIRDHHYNHSDAQTTHNKLSESYHGIPFSAVELFVSGCPVCKDSKPSSIKHSSFPPTNNGTSCCSDDNERTKNQRKFMRRGQVELLPNFLNSTVYGVGLYLDVWSNYHVLFPVDSTHNCPAHFATALVKRVYPYYGVPRYFVSTLGTEFVDELIGACAGSWPDAANIANHCNKSKGQTATTKRALKSKVLIGRLLGGCGQELDGIELSLSAMEDLLLSIQYKVNILINKKSRKCPFELVFGQLPVPGPQTQQLLIGRHMEMMINLFNDDSDEDGEGAEIGGIHNMNISSACLKNGALDDHIMMSRLAQNAAAAPTGSTGNSSRSNKQIQQMLAAGTIQAQEQQVTSLRELLRQEEKRLEMLKQLRTSSPAGSAGASTVSKKVTPSKGTVHVTGVDSTHGVIRSTHGLVAPAQEPTNTPISSRLQQLVDSVAVTQISSQASQLKKQSAAAAAGSGSSKVNQKIQSKASSLTIPQNGIQRVVTELDEATIVRTIESSSRYKEFLLKQSNLKRTFQKQMDKKIGSAPYPKTFRQVWPIIPVHDPNFVKNVGLECVTQYFDPNYQKPPVQPSKIKPTCNQCGCDFASAWQIRKNNSKQVLLCESCDFTNLKLFQRSKLATQLKELMETVHKEEDKFQKDCEEAKKSTIAIEKASLLNKQHQQPTVVTMNRSDPSGSTVKHSITVKPVIANGSPHILIPSMLTTPTSAGNKRSESSRKRKSGDDHGVSKVVKTSPNLDNTLNKISQQLIRKQVDEKVRKRPASTGITTHVISSAKAKGPPPLKQVSPVSKTGPTQPLPPQIVYSSELTNTVNVASITTPPPLINNVGGNDSRKNRRKGTPRHKLMGNE